MMTLHEALEVLSAHRGRRVVVTTMSAATAWPALSDTPLDFTYVPSSMGMAPALGLGLALARGSGIPRVYAFADADAWRAGAAEALSGPGPVVVWLKVEGRMGQKAPKAPRPMAEQIARLKGALGV